MRTKTAFPLTLALALAAFASSTDAQLIDTNCKQPIATLNSCPVTPDGCWIETEREVLPWMPAAPASSTNPRNFRAFCSEENSTDDSHGRWYRYSIYLPPGYDLPANAEVEYPVVYWMMGTLENVDDYASRGGNVAALIEKRITQRAIRPAIYVFPYGGVDSDAAGLDWIDQWTDGDPAGKPGCDPDNPSVCFRADAAFDELIAHIEANYRVLSKPEARAIQGFSRGGGYTLQRAFRPVDGEYLFGSVAGLSAAKDWEASRYPIDAEELALDYANAYPNEADRPIDLLLKHGDFELDQSAIPTADFSTFLTSGLDVGGEPIAHDYEHVVPACGEERRYAPPCDGPPALEHDQPRMLDLRGDDVLAFHQTVFSRLSAEDLAQLDAHQLACAMRLPNIVEEPIRFDPNEAYLAGDFDGDGCESVALRENGAIVIDNDYDHKPETIAVFGPDDAQYFAIDWWDQGRDDLGYAEWDTPNCRGAWEIGFYTEDRDGDGHDFRDEPSFCFDAAPEGAEFLVGDFDGDHKDDVAYRVDNELFWTPFLASGHNGTVTGSTQFGTKTEDQWATGRFVPGQRTESLAIRRGNEYLLNGDLDGAHDVSFRFGGGNEDQYLFGDWDGDGLTNVAIRRCNLLLLDTTFDGAHDFQYYFGWGTEGACDE